MGAVFIFGDPPAPAPVPPPQIETLVQAEARRAAYAAKVKSEKLTEERKKYVCEQKSICSKFGEFRQTCATAGNYDTCMKIKMGNDIDRVIGCMNDGSVAFAPKDVPDWSECLILAIPWHWIKTKP